MRILASSSKKTAWFLRIATVLVFMLTWYGLTTLHLIPARLIPTIPSVYAAATEIRPNILVHAGYTASLVGIGLIIGTLAGIYFGLWMRRSFVWRHVLAPLIESSRPIPPVAIVPFFIIWFGFSWEGKVLLVTLGVFLVVVIGVLEAIDRVDPTHIRIGLAFGADSSTLIDKVILPSILPRLLAPIRIALATAIGLAVTSEFMGATLGLGHVLNIALNTFAVNTVLLCALVLGAMGSVMDSIVRIVHHRLVRWSSTAADAIVGRPYTRQRS